MSRSHSNALAAAVLLSAVFGPLNFAAAIDQPSRTGPVAQTAAPPPPPTPTPKPDNTKNSCELPNGLSCPTTTPKGSNCICNGHPGQVK